MRCSLSSSSLRATGMALAISAGLVAAAGMVIGGEANVRPAGDSERVAARAGKNLLVNGGFEQHTGVGTIATGWEVLDENVEYFGWIAPRVERTIGGIGPRTGRYMIGMATDMMGVDTNDKGFHIPRSAIFQTITVESTTRGKFSLYYNDLESTALAHIAAIRLAYTVNSTSISTIKFPATFSPEPSADLAKPGVWSKPFFRVSQKLPLARTAVGDWSLAAIPVVVESAEAKVRLTLWIGIFDHQNSTELGYYRIDDASFVVHPSQ